MPRLPRSTPAGFCYHIWNRAAGGLRLFRKDADFLAFEKVLLQAHERFPLPILDWVLMGNHWHFVVQPKTDGQVTQFFRWLTQTHAMRVRVQQNSSGTGPLYQGRFKATPVKTDRHLRTVLRYVERNPVRAKLTRSAMGWRWGSAHVRRHGPAELAAILSPWPVPQPRDWAAWVDAPQRPEEVDALRLAIQRGRPIGDAPWVAKTAAKLDLQSTLRPRGRPKKLTR